MLKTKPLTGKRHPCAIRFPDHTGDSVVATYDRADAATVKIADKALDEFWQQCIEQYGAKAMPLVSGHYPGDDGNTLLRRGDSVAPFVDILFTPPLSGG